MSFAEGEIEREQACGSRDECWNPIFKAGVRIYNGGVQTNYGMCTMGFHIETSLGDEQFLTAGHCYGVEAHSWYHGTYGLIGNEGAKIYFENGYDVMRVHMSDVRASNRVYADGLPVWGSITPRTGMSVCASLGNTNTVDCGTVTDDWLSWQGSRCECTLWGGDYDGIATQPGDSGSPVVTHNATHALAVGIHATASGKFARVSDALIHWNSTVVGA